MTKQKHKKKDLEEEVHPVKSSQGEVAEGEFNGVNKEEEYLNNWKRAVADFENLKKQQAESQKEFAKFANLNLIMQILPVLDNFSAATEHIPEDQKDNPWVTGIMYIQKQLEQVLKDNGVEEVETKEGDKFNPELHEAVSGEKQEEEAEKEIKNKISKVLNKGYRIDGKVIRAARVIVE